LLATGVICVDLGGLLLCVRRLVTLGLAVSAIASIVAVVSAAAVALTVVVAVLAVVALSVTGSVTGSISVLRTLAAAISLALFRFRLRVTAKQHCPEPREQSGLCRFVVSLSLAAAGLALALFGRLLFGADLGRRRIGRHASDQCLGRRYRGFVGGINSRLGGRGEFDVNAEFS
jgi:hypothetical protein